MTFAVLIRSRIENRGDINEKAISKPIKPSKNLVYCYACKKRKMLFEEKSEADNFIRYNQGGILEENGKAPQSLIEFM